MSVSRLGRSGSVEEEQSAALQHALDAILVASGCQSYTQLQQEGYESSLDASQLMAHVRVIHNLLQKFLEVYEAQSGKISTHVPLHIFDRHQKILENIRNAAFGVLQRRLQVAASRTPCNC